VRECTADHRVATRLANAAFIRKPVCLTISGTNVAGTEPFYRGLDPTGEFALTVEGQIGRFKPLA
jgi:hypothetical protein